MKSKKYITCFISTLVSLNLLISANAKNNDSIYVQNLLDSVFYTRHNNKESSILLAQKALRIADKKSYTRLKIDAMNILGIIYYTAFERVDSGYRYITKAYEKSKEINYAKGLAYYSYFNGVTEIYRGNYPKAISNFHDALDVAETIDDKRLIATIYSGMGNVSMRHRKFNEARRYVRNAYNYYTALNDLYEITNNDMKMGYLYGLEDSLEQAKFYYLKVIRMLNEMNDSIRVLFPKTYLATIYAKEKKYKQAINLLEKTILKIKKTDYYDLHISAYYSLSNVYKSIKRFDMAYFYQNEAYRIRDSVYTIEKLDRVYETQMAYQKEQKIKETNELKKANEIKSLQIKNTRNIAIFICSILLLLSILLFVISKRHKFEKEVAVRLQSQQDKIHRQEKELIKQENEKIKQKLEYQKRDLTSKVFQLSQNNELGSRLVTSLKALQLKIKTKGQIGEDLRTHVQSIINEIKFTSNTRMWNEFELYFNKVNPGFIKWLTENYPDLTKNDIRLCTFAMLNLKTNEISKVTFQNSKTINVARARLRKKLGIDKQNITLTTYLHQHYSGTKRGEKVSA